VQTLCLKHHQRTSLDVVSRVVSTFLVGCLFDVVSIGGLQ
jgi:hypothetical protein